MTHDNPAADRAPEGPFLTEYDRASFARYLRILDAHAGGADWQDVCRAILCRDPVSDPKAWTCYQGHLDRALWMTRVGYREILRTGATWTGEYT